MKQIARTLTIAATLLVAAFASQPAHAIVPPKDCKFITVKHHRYNIKADQLKCRSARDYATRYLKTKRKPRGYRCDNFKNSALVFKCVNAHYNPDRTFFAIKR